MVFSINGDRAGENDMLPLIDHSESALKGIRPDAARAISLPKRRSVSTVAEFGPIVPDPFKLPTGPCHQGPSNVPVIADRETAVAPFG